MTSPPALIEPEVLIWARRSANLSVAAVANKVGVKPAVVESWEGGEKHPSIAQARKLAAAYKFPLAVLFLSEPPKDFQPMKDFRSRPTGVATSTQLLYEIRRAQEKREVALELASGLPETPVRFTVSAEQSEPAKVGKRLRAALGIELSSQLAWQTDYAALRAWKTAIEARGALVFEMRGVAVHEARGFSVSHAVFPVIGLNGSDAVYGRIFTLMHELAHLALRNAGVCDEDDASPVEMFCNQVAAELLVPAAALLARPEAVPRREVDYSDLSALSRMFKVSREVILIRLAELKRITHAAKERAQKRIRREGEAAPKKGGRVPQHTLALKKHGDAFTGLVLAAYRNDNITLSDASAILEVKLKHLAKIAATLESRTE